MAESKRKRIFIVDDHPLVRAGVARAIETEGEFDVCGEAGSLDSALAGIESAVPDVVLVDISLGVSNGIDLIRQLKRDKPGIRVLVISMHDEPVYVERALKAGASGYILKRESVQKVTTAERAILEGRNYVSEGVSSSLVDLLRGQDPSEDICPREILSGREVEVFQLLGQGHSRKEISDTLNISPKTVESHIERMKEKLNIESGTRLVHYAIQHTSK